MADLNRPKRRLPLASGVIAAALTPMEADGRASAGRLAAHCRNLLAAGCSSVVVLGTTGEANSFTTGERQALLEGVLAAGIAPDQLIAGTGCCATGDTAALTRHALSLGITRVLVLPPFYYKNVSDEGLFAAYAHAIERTGDARLRLYLYRIPQITGIDISSQLVGRLLEAFPEVLAGIKDSTGAWDSTRELCERFAAHIDVLAGNETLLVPAVRAGASGCISATANANAASIVRLLRESAVGDTADLQREIEATRAAFEAYGVIPALKAFLVQSSGNDTWLYVRPPLQALGSAQRADLLRALRAISDRHTKV